MASPWRMSITPEDRYRQRKELVNSFQTHNETITIGDRVGPQQCALFLEGWAYDNANSRTDYEQKISQCLRLSPNSPNDYERLLAQWPGLNVGGGSSQPRAVGQGSSSSSSMDQAAALSQPSPVNQALGSRSPARQQLQQQNQVPVQIQQAQVQNEPATQDAEIMAVPIVESERDKVWAKLQVLNTKYLQDMNELYIMLTHRSNQPMPAEQLQKLKHYKDVLHRMIPYLRVPKERVPKEFNMEKVEAFEKQITSIMDTFKRRRNPQQEVGNGAPAVAGVEVN